MSPTTDVAVAVRRATTVMTTAKYDPWDAIPYDLVVSILRYELEYDDDAAHQAIFDAVMDGAVVISMSRVRPDDRTEQSCLEAK